MTDEFQPAIESWSVVPPPVTTPPPTISLATTRGLLGASFELLVRSSRDLRHASFYIGAIVLGTVGPLVLASWGFEVLGFDRSFDAYQTGMGAAGGLLVVLGMLAAFGLGVAAVESRIMAVAVLGGRMSERPVSTRGALVRARQTFWRAIVASIVVAVPLLLAQGIVSELVDPRVGLAFEFSIVASTLVSAVIGAPFAYVLAGVVLGDVDPFEAVRRSFVIYRARKLAAVIVAGFETVTALLLLLGLGAGLDVVLRVVTALGIGPGSTALGLALATAVIVAVVFAVGTLLFTVMAITIAPQVVMFVGLTHATHGLDRVRTSVEDDPDRVSPGGLTFHWITRAMLLGFVLGGVGLALSLIAFGG